MKLIHNVFYIMNETIQFQGCSLIYTGLLPEELDVPGLLVTLGTFGLISVTSYLGCKSMDCDIIIKTFVKIISKVC